MLAGSAFNVGRLLPATGSLKEPGLVLGNRVKNALFFNIYNSYFGTDKFSGNMLIDRKQNSCLVGYDHFELWPRPWPLGLANLFLCPRSRDFMPRLTTYTPGSDVMSISAIDFMVCLVIRFSIPSASVTKLFTSSCFPTIFSKF